MTELAIKFIRIYQKTYRTLAGLFSAGLFVPPACNFEPSCSEYSIQALRKYGMGKGLIKTLKRIIRCHPWAQPRVDIP